MALIFTEVVFMASLPTVGGSTGTWGTELNNFLTVSMVGTTGALTDLAVSTPTTVTKTASYQLVYSDIGKLIIMNVVSANTLTIPSDAIFVTAPPIGSTVLVLQQGAGITTIAANGITRNSRGAIFTLAGTWATATLIKYAANAWVISGDLA